jgi:two-component system response regulator AtoC
MHRVLIVDDDPGVLFTVEEALAAHATVSARSGQEALAKLEDVDVVVTDLSMPGMDGLALLAEIKKRDPELPVILLTAHGSERVAVQAMKDGAHDYLKKPFAVDELRLVVERAAEVRSLRRYARDKALEKRRLVGKSAAFTRVVADAIRVAPRDVTVLLRGETGTGKELVAALIHASSARREGPFVRFNCAAIPTELAESELFGHAKGAFTGATSARSGYFREAHGGTLVLDEIGELPLALQGKLLRAVQSGEVQPLGGSRTERADVRIVAATHKDLAAEVKAGRFREDLYYRLAVVELVLPPLRERREDIPELAAELTRVYAARFGLEDVRLSPRLVESLTRDDWPGNVRQLENTIARLLALSTGGVIDVDALDGRPPTSGGALRDQVATFERAVIMRALEDAGGNQSEAARRLKVTRVTLIDKMKRHGLY